MMLPPDPTTLRTFIENVAPEVRERVAAARAQLSSEPTVRTAVAARPVTKAGEL
jgi:hypothetical protein